MTKKRRWVEVAGAGALAGVVIACGDAMVDAGGAAMQDAGDWLADAGAALAGAGADRGDAGTRMPMGTLPDGGEALADAGGSAGGVLQDAGAMLRDAGDMLRDAGLAIRDGSTVAAPDGATAQSTCGSCSPGNTQRILIASEDPAQLRGATAPSWTLLRGTAVVVSGCGNYEDRAYYAELGEGALVLTDTLVAQGSVRLHTVPVGDSCVEITAPTSLYSVTCGSPPIPHGVPLTDVVRPPPSARLLLTAINGAPVTGARVWIPQGEKLCAITGSSGVTPASAGENPATSVFWSGFVPYD